MVYAKPFFDLQLGFAEKVTAVSGLPLSRALLEYTNLYVRFGLGRAFDAAHPAWRAYLAGVERGDDLRAWTYAFYLTKPGPMMTPPVEASSGCFAYARLDDTRIRLHFQDAETDGHSPLARDRVPQRLADLAALFAHVKRDERRPLRVVGASWLYNVAAYRRLFPSSYLATAHVKAHRFQHMPLWGQFLDRHGALKDTMTRPFLLRLEHQQGVERLADCFPFQALSVEAPASEFYDFYGV